MKMNEVQKRPYAPPTVRSSTQTTSTVLLACTKPGLPYPCIDECGFESCAPTSNECTC